MDYIKKTFTGLRGKFMMVLFLSFIFAGAVLMLIVFKRIKPGLEERSKSHLYETTELVSDMIELQVKSAVKNHLSDIADRTWLQADYQYRRYQRGEITEKQAYTLFKKNILDPVYGKIGKTGYMACVDTQGVLVIHPKAEGVSALSHDFMKRAVEMKNGYLEYEWKNPGEKKARKKAGALRYFEPWDFMVWASSYRSEFLDLIDRASIEKIVKNIKIGKSGYGVIMKPDGSVAGSGISLPKHISSKIKKELKKELKKAGKPAVSKKTLSSQSAEGSTYLVRMPFGLRKGEEKTPFVYGIRYVPSLDFYLVSAVSVKETIESARATITAIFITVIIGYILTVLAASYVFGKILKPVETIQFVSSAVSGGDLTKRAEENGNDEIATVSYYINKIIDNFSEVLASIKETSFLLAHSIQDLSSSSQEISSTSNQQAAAVKEIVSTMEDSDALAKSISGKIEEVTRVASDTSKTVNEGYTIIKDSLTKMEEIRGANTETIEGIKKLGTKIESIWEIVNIINGIADQTKIIAFNAELEASAAGEAGKNFQIVATEIRRLADNTVSSTSEIKNKINEIQHSSDRLIITSEDGTEKIKQGSELSRNLKLRFDDILRSSEVSENSSVEITRSIKQQVTAFEQILQTLKQISQGIENFTISTKSLTDSAQGLKENSMGLKELLSRYDVSGDASQEKPKNGNGSDVDA